MRRQKQYKNSVSSRIIKIATVAVAIGMATILIAVAVTKGLQQTIRNQAVAFNGHMLISPFENSESKISVRTFIDSQEMRHFLEAHPEVRHVSPIATKVGILKTAHDFEGILLKGVGQNFDWTLLENFLTDGRFPSFEEGTLSNEILISSVIASRMGLAVGASVEAFFQNFKEGKLPNRRKFNVVGIYFSGFPEIDENLAYGDLKQIQRLNKWKPHEIGGYEVFIDNIKNIDAMGGDLYSEMPSDADLTLLTEQYAGIFQWISLFDFNTLIIIVMMVLVGVINMATALLALILERSRMIGLLKTLGAQNALVQKVFLYNGIMIIGRGLFFGNLIGMTFYFSQKYWGWITLDPVTYFVKEAPVFIGLWEVVALNFLVLLVSALLLWLPSMAVLKISPSKVLRIR